MSTEPTSRNEKIKMSNLLFWQGKGAKSSLNGQQGTAATPNGRNWIHSTDSLVNNHVVYLVKFLGTTQVDQPKGIEVVKDAIRRLQFNQQLKKSEAKSEAKCKKVEITISVNGVAIQEPRTSNVLYQFPLHRISYCADDKGAKKYFSFIAKSQANEGGDSATNVKETHECFVFISAKLASEITLTIGQAFDLAYKRFLNDNGRLLEMQKLSLQVKKLDLQVQTYKQRLQDLSKRVYKDDLISYLSNQNIKAVTDFKVPKDLQTQIQSLTMNGVNKNHINGSETSDLGLELSSSLTSDINNMSNSMQDLLLATPPSQHNGRTQLKSSSTGSDKNPTVGPRLEELLLDSDSDSDFDPRRSETTPTPSNTSSGNNIFNSTMYQQHNKTTSQAVTSHHVNNTQTPLIAPPPKTTKRQTQPPTQQQTHQNGVNDLFGSTPFSIQQPANNIQTPINGQAFQINGQTFQNNGQIVPTMSNGFQMQPNYNISEFDMTTSVFDTNNTFTNGLAGYDPFDTQKFGTNGNIFNTNGNTEKQAVALDSNFTGFLDKRISEMKDGFSRGLTFGNVDFSQENNDPFKTK